MAQVNYVSSMAQCAKCGQPKISVGQDQQCLKCDAQPGTSTRVVDIEDPGDAKMREVLTKAGVVVPTGGVTKMDKGLAIPKDAKIAVAAQYVPAGLGCTVSLAESTLKGYLSTPSTPEQEYEVVFTPGQLEALQDYLLGLETPKDMREARKLIKLIDRIDQLLGR